MKLSSDSRFPGRADLAIDLGTANTIVIERRSGIIFREPSVCCFHDDGVGVSLFAAGSKAHAMIGRVGRPLQIAKPLRDGVLSDMAAGRELIRYAARQLGGGWRLRKARALIGVPADATQAEQRALVAAAHDAGLGRVRLLPEPLLAAIGAGLDIDAPRGRMIVDCGAGITEVVVISLGSICLSTSVRIGGDTLDEALIEHLHFKHRFQVGRGTAEGLKLELARLAAGKDDGHETNFRIKGHSLATGRPEMLCVPAAELNRVYEKHFGAIVDIVRSALAGTPPELSRDILEDEILITGGASMAGLLRERIADATGVETRLAAAPLECVARGLARLIDGDRLPAAP